MNPLLCRRQLIEQGTAKGISPCRSPKPSIRGLYGLFGSFAGPLDLLMRYGASGLTILPVISNRLGEMPGMAWIFSSSLFISA